MNLRLWKIINLVFALLVLALVALFRFDLWRYVLGGSLALLLLAGLNLWVLRQTAKIGEDYLLLILPLLFLAGLAGTAATISNLWLRFVVAVLGSGLLYVYQTYIPSSGTEAPLTLLFHKPPLFLEDLFSLGAMFLVLASLFGFNFFFLAPWWAVSLLTFFLFYVFFRQDFYKQARPPAENLLWALVAAFLMVEVNWVLLFWPVYFLTAAVVSFCGFYLLYNFSAMHFQRRLSRQKIYFQLSVTLILLLGSLLTSPWQPLR